MSPGQPPPPATTPRRTATLLLALGFASGLPLALTGETLQAWLKSSGVDIATIGFLTWVGMPYSFKFVWAPLLDRFRLPWLGRRRGWIVLTQLVLLGAIAVMGASNPTSAMTAMAAMAVLVAFASASQDIVADGYRADLLRAKDLAAGTTTFLVGYRIAMLVATSGALLAVDYLVKLQDVPTDDAWRLVYLGLAGLMAVGIVATLAAPEPVLEAAPPKTLTDAVVLPFAAFFRRDGAVLALAFVAIYRLSDALLLTTPFYLEIGFTLTELATYRKIIGVACMLAGFAVGGWMVARIGVRRSLWIGGASIALSNLCFAGLALVGKDYVVFGLAVGIDSVCSGISGTAFTAFLLQLCDKRYSATQFALLTSAAALVGRFLGGFSGLLIEELGWFRFFVATVLAGIPTMILLWRLPESLTAVRAEAEPVAETPTASHAA